jgi:hypothetical protein
VEADNLIIIENHQLSRPNYIKLPSRKVRAIFYASIKFHDSGIAGQMVCMKAGSRVLKVGLNGEVGNPQGRQGKTPQLFY